MKEKVMMNKCYTCIYRKTIPGNAHSSCASQTARVTANDHGIQNGWFYFPFNFDPVWLVTCDGYKEKEGKEVK